MALSVIGVVGTASMSGLFIVKNIAINKLNEDFIELSNDYSALQDDYENNTDCYNEMLENYNNLTYYYETLIYTYSLLLEDNSGLQEEYDALLVTYNLLLSNYNDLQANYNALDEAFSNLQADYDALEDAYNQIQLDYSALQDNLNTLSDLYDDLQNSYNQLQNDYDSLENSYNNLLIQYNTLVDDYNDLQYEFNAYKSYIKQLILPLQYSVFAEAVRRYYLPIYLGWKTGKTYWMSFTEYCRDIVLHDSVQENSFQTVSDAFSDCLKYDSNSTALADDIMHNTFWDWLPNWDGRGLTGNKLSDINTVHQWCINEIEYEYDIDITVGQESFMYDYIKFPVETAFRTMGDCEDQAILDAAYLESCGFETAIAIIHDEAHPLYGSFYHGTLLVHIEDTTAFHTVYPGGILWRLGTSDPYYDDGFTWCWLDPTWDTPFGGTPAWLQGYMDASGISETFCTVAFCDIDGVIF